MSNSESVAMGIAQCAGRGLNSCAKVGAQCVGNVGTSGGSEQSCREAVLKGISWCRGIGTRDVPRAKLRICRSGQNFGIAVDVYAAVEARQAGAVIVFVETIGAMRRARGASNARAQQSEPVGAVLRRGEMPARITGRAGDDVQQVRLDTRIERTSETSGVGVAKATAVGVQAVDVGWIWLASRIRADDRAF